MQLQNVRPNTMAIARAPMVCDAFKAFYPHICHKIDKKKTIDRLREDARGCHKFKKINNIRGSMPGALLVLFICTKRKYMYEKYI